MRQAFFKVYLSSLAKTIVKHDFFYRYRYTTVKKFPKFTNITLKLDIKNFSYKYLTAILLALELVLVKKGSIVKEKKLKIFLKLKKGYTTHSTIILKKDLLNNFLDKIINKELLISQTDFFISKSSHSFIITSIFNNKHLKDNYNFFKHTPPVYFTVNASTKSSSELLFLLKAYKIKQL